MSESHFIYGGKETVRCRSAASKTQKNATATASHYSPTYFRPSGDSEPLIKDETLLESIRGYFLTALTRLVWSYNIGTENEVISTFEIPDLLKGQTRRFCKFAFSTGELYFVWADEIGTTGGTFTDIWFPKTRPGTGPPSEGDFVASVSPPIQLIDLGIIFSHLAPQFAVNHDQASEFLQEQLVAVLAQGFRGVLRWQYGHELSLWVSFPQNDFEEVGERMYDLARRFGTK